MCHRACRANRAIVLAFLMAVVASLGTYAAVAPPLGGLSDGLARLGGRCDRLAAAQAESRSDADSIRARLGSLDAHLAESVRIAHDRRAALADELRAEMAAGLAAVRGEISTIPPAARPEVTRGDVARLAGIDLALQAEIRAVLARLVAIEGQLKALESRKPPERVVERVETRVVERPVAVVQPAQYLCPILPRRCR